MFQYNSAKEMKCFLDKNIDCKTKEGKDLLEQIKHYLDWPLQLYALQEAEYLLQVELGREFDNLTIPEKIISRLAEDLCQLPTTQRSWACNCPVVLTAYTSDL